MRTHSQDKLRGDNKSDATKSCFSSNNRRFTAKNLPGCVPNVWPCHSETVADIAMSRDERPAAEVPPLSAAPSSPLSERLYTPCPENRPEIRKQLTVLQ